MDNFPWYNCSYQQPLEGRSPDTCREKVSLQDSNLFSLCEKRRERVPITFNIRIYSYRYRYPNICILYLWIIFIVNGYQSWCHIQLIALTSWKVLSVALVSICFRKAHAVWHALWICSLHGCRKRYLDRAIWQLMLYSTSLSTDLT